MDFRINDTFKYKIICKKCGQSYYRQKLARDFQNKYECAKHGGKLIIENI